MRVLDIEIGAYYLIAGTLHTKQIPLDGVARVIAMNDYAVQYHYYDKKGNLLDTKCAFIGGFADWVVKRVKPRESQDVNDQKVCKGF